MKKLLFTIITILLFSITTLAQITPKGYTLTWDANSEPDLAGYKVYIGTTSRQYTMIAELGLVTVYDGTVQVPNDAVTTFYFAVTAFDTANLESDYSNEVFQKFDTRIPPSPPKNLKWYERLLSWFKSFFYFV